MNKNNICKKITAFMLAFVMCLALCACSLIDYSETQNENGQLKITEDFMVGFFLYVIKYEGLAGSVVYPTASFEDENAIYLYAALKTEYDMTYYTLVSSDYLTDIAFAMTNGGTTVNEESSYGKIEVKATLLYTHELMGGIFCINDVYMKNGQDEYYAKEDSQHSYSNYTHGGMAVSITQNIKVSSKDSLGTEQTLEYDGVWTVGLQFVDYLIGARVVEFDKDHNVIKTHNIDLTASDLLEPDSFLEYKTQPDCEYIFFEEDYEVKHSSEYYKPQGTIYTKRQLFNKSDSTEYLNLGIPVGNGFVKSTRLSVEF